MKTHKIASELESLSRPIDWFKSDPRNVRIHDSSGIDAIAKSLDEFGQNKNIVALDDGTVIAGNGTLLAAKKLGWTHLAAMVFHDSRKASAYAIADNSTGDKSDWDVASLLEQISSLDSDLAVATGLDEIDLMDLSEPFVPVSVGVDELKSHPRNYRGHPLDQIEHLVKSISENGFYRNVVVAKDNTILAGHGVVQAAIKMGKKRIPVIRLPISPDEPRALKVLASDNEIGNLANVDDRALTELLKDIMSGDGLLGTGFDEEQLAALAFHTRPESEIKDKDHAAEWVGMPEFNQGEKTLKAVVSFRSRADRDEFLRVIGVSVSDPNKQNISTWWPVAERRDISSVRFKDGSK